ncbi:MAG: transketolase, partial [Thiothrix sp.]|nr:transketolase [Thiothrix sp.]
DNQITIDGSTDLSTSEDIPARYRAAGWHVEHCDGHEYADIERALQAATESDRPSLVACRTVIGKGAPNKEGGHDVHGAPLGADEIAAARRNLGWKHEPFVIPDAIYAGWNARKQGAAAASEWETKFKAYRAAYPAEAAEFQRRIAGELPDNWTEAAQKAVEAIQAKAESPATRVASRNALNAFAPLLPEFLGGSADLSPSNNTFNECSKGINSMHGPEQDFSGNYLSYGVREFGMSAIMNGIALHGGFIPYGATFLMFSEYARNALRMAALMKIRSIFVYTHDSIGLGEDGPTHQGVEQTASLRLIPRMSVWRPCDGVETVVAWRAAIEQRQGPSCLILTRQNLPHQQRDAGQLAAIARGGYVLKDCDGTPQAIIIATGSEVALAMAAADKLTGRRVRVVSMPSTDTFAAQDEAYRESVLPASVTARVAVEAGATGGWYQYVGLAGKVIGIDTFGESAPAGVLFKHFGFTVEHVVAAVESVL